MRGCVWRYVLRPLLLGGSIMILAIGGTFWLEDRVQAHQVDLMFIMSAMVALCVGLSLIGVGIMVREIWRIEHAAAQVLWEREHRESLEDGAYDV